jgi:hypothetical protein
MPDAALVNDTEYQRLSEARGRAWQALLDAAGAVWAGDRLCAGGAPDETLATVAGRRVGTDKVREIVAAIEVADAELASFERRASRVA